MKKLIFIGLLFFVSFCAREEIDLPEEIATLENLVVVSGDQEPLHKLEPKRQVTFGDSEQVIIGQLSTATIDRNGNVYIGDSRKNMIHSYTPDGIYSGSIGREGGGPGEFRLLIYIGTNESHLYAFDLNSYRISVFELESHEFVHSFIIPFIPEIISGTFSHPMSFYLPNNKNQILISFSVSPMARDSEDDGDPVLYGKLLNIDSLTFEEGRIYEVPTPERIVHRDDSGMVTLAPDYKRSSHVKITDEYILSAWNEHLLFKFHDYNGNYKKALYYPVNRIPIDKNEIIRSYDESSNLVQRLIRNDHIPDFYPAFKRSILDDENRIWVATYTDDLDILNWKIFTFEGDLFASFDWPDSISIMQIQNGFVYTIETDEDTGVREIVKYSYRD